jgi:ADP-ribose pyrophosphatase YjhB (NUDIX family)
MDAYRSFVSSFRRRTRRGHRTNIQPSLRDSPRLPDKARPLEPTNSERVKKLIIATGLLRRDASLLLVRTRYPDEPKPLWTLPGGRQKAGEMLEETVVRECLEEASLSVRATSLAYVSESVDEPRALHVINSTFWVSEHESGAEVVPQDRSVVEARFVPVDEALRLLRADVLRIPVGNALRKASEVRYYAFHPHDIKVQFFGSGRR